MILKRIQRRFNIVRKSGKGPGNWAGSRHFVRQGDILIDPNLNQPLQYLHWAGIRMEPGCPYWDIWEHYRYLDGPEPAQPFVKKPEDPLWRKVVNQVKRAF